MNTLTFSEVIPPPRALAEVFGGEQVNAVIEENQGISPTKPSKITSKLVINLILFGSLQDWENTLNWGLEYEESVGQDLYYETRRFIANREEGIPTNPEGMSAEEGIVYTWLTEKLGGKRSLNTGEYGHRVATIASHSE